MVIVSALKKNVLPQSCAMTKMLLSSCKIIKTAQIVLEESRMAYGTADDDLSLVMFRYGELT